MPEMATVEVSFTALPAHVRPARRVATAGARRSGVDEALLDEVRLAVGEACSRAVEAHRLYCPAEPVKIELTTSGGRFEVVVPHPAPAEPAAVPAAEPSQAAASGGPGARMASTVAGNGHGGLQDGIGLAV